jgi:hypothetical protein
MGGPYNFQGNTGVRKEQVRVRITYLQQRSMGISRFSATYRRYDRRWRAWFLLRRTTVRQ